MTTYRISFTNKYNITHCFKLDNLFDIRNFIKDDELKGVIIVKEVDDIIEYFVIYRGGKRERKILVNWPLMK
jgi:hypothetical protein